MLSIYFFMATFPSMRARYTGPVEPTSTYRGRLAPSPTGLLHMGHVRTFAVARGRARAGLLLLRIDDLDPQRSRPEFIESAEQDLRWLGLAWAGEPRRQSLRGAAYHAAWERLVAGGFVYPCRCSRRDLAQSASAPHERSAGVEDEPLYPGTCRPAWMPASAALPRARSLRCSASLPAAPDGAQDRARWLAAGPEGANWRFRVPLDEAVRWTDGGLGPQTFTAGRHFGDFAVWRRDGVPAYQLATVVDDAAMHITEVVRGADLLLSTARQLLLCRALGLTAPAWLHCPLVVDETGNRLAKRVDALSVRSLREQGLTPAAVLALAEAARLQ